MMLLAEMARSANATLEARPEKREMAENATSLADATATPP